MSVTMLSKKMHIGALVAFALAFLFYFLANSVAIAFGVVGAVMEIAAWAIWISSSNQKDQSTESE